MKGVDFAYGWRPGLGAEIAAALVDGEHPAFVGRYLPYPGVDGKAITREEAADYHANGLAILFFMEKGGAGFRGGAAQGATDARDAALAMGQLGVPSGVAAHFAIDTDTTPADYPLIVAYQDAAIAAIGSKPVGAYGEADVVEYLAASGLASSFVQCEAWSRGRLSQAANVYQYARQTTIGGVSMDILAATGLRGMWVSPAVALAQEAGKGDGMGQLDELNTAIVKREDIRRVASGTDDKGYAAMLKAWDLLKKEGIIP